MRTLRSILDIRSLRLSGALLALSVLTGLAEERVVILNSDASVEKYQVAQAAFKASWPEPTLDVDLGDEFLSEDELVSRIKDLEPETVYCIGSTAYKLAHRVLDRDSTVVLSSAINWQRFPPRQNTLVIANELPTAAQLSLYRYFFPSLRRVGVVLAYYLVCGQLPFRGDGFEDIKQAQCEETPVPPSLLPGCTVPMSLEAVILKCLAKDPAERLQSATLLLKRLKACDGVGDWTQREAKSWWTAHLPEKTGRRFWDAPQPGTTALGQLDVKLG